MPDHIKILVVDPNAGALAALRDSLSSASDLEFVGDAGLGPVALTWARTLQPDVVIVAVDEPAARPLATIELLARGNPSWTVLGLMSQFDQELFRKAVLAGATDVLLRSTPGRDLLSAQGLLVLDLKDVHQASLRRGELRSRHVDLSSCAGVGS